VLRPYDGDKEFAATDDVCTVASLVADVQGSAMRKAAAERDDVDRAAGLINGSLATEVPDLQRGPEGDCAA